MEARIEIDPDIRTARTLPAWCYRDVELFERLRERVFARSWQIVGDVGLVPTAGSASPFVFLEGAVEEPLLLTRDLGGVLHVLSNVCTHRGNLVVGAAGKCRGLRCGYHGRRFALDGRFESMPEFGEARGFPTVSDDLPQLPLGTWGSLLFAGIRPAFPFEEWVGDARARLGGISFEGLRFDASRSKDFEVRANWALYLDNYLEGFHIPFVHAGLNQALDYGSYATETYRWGSLQVGYGGKPENGFSLPASSPHAGKVVAAYYLWLFPNTMLNVYPWGVSVNVVKPLAVDRTRVSFLSYVRDTSRLDRGAGSSLDRVEAEDEAVVEAVQRGVRSSLYERGRYSPTREQGVHHFHRMIAAALAS